MLIGRERELTVLLDACRAAAGGRGSTVVVEGDPGIGKTALLHAVEAADAGWTVVAAVGVETETAVPFATLQALLWPLRDALGQLEQTQRRLLAGVLELGPPAAASTFAVGAATLALLSTVSRHAPHVAIVDDAHWADLASQEVLCFVGRRVDSERLAVLAGVRTQEPCLLSDDRSFARLSLAPLDEGDARAVLERAGGGLAADVVRQLVVACAGNPLGLVEVPGLLTAAQRDGSEPLPVAIGGPLVQRAFAARVGELSPDAGAALLLLAAAAEPESALRAMSATERSGLAEAEEAQLVTRAGAVDFRHPLMRAAIYGAASPSARHAAHRRLAAVVPGVRRAWHLAEAVGAPDEAVAAALEQAAGDARAAGGVAAEAQALERAGALTPEPDRGASRYLGAARAWRLAGRIARADAALSAAARLAETRRTRGEVALERGSNLMRERAYREAYEVLVGEVAHVEETEPGLAARFHAILALLANVYPEAPPSVASAERALELAGGRGDEVELEALFAAIASRMARPRPPDAEDERLVDRAAELVATKALRVGEQAHWIAYTLAELERDARARSLSDLAIAEARAAGDVWSLCYGLYARAACEVTLGRIDLARSWAAEAIPLAEQIGERWRLDEAEAVRLEVESARGSVEACERAFEAASAAGTPPLETRIDLGRALLAVGRAADAVAPLEAAARELAVGAPRSWYRLVPLDLAEAYVASGRRADAEALVRQVAGAIGGGRLLRPRAKLARLVALLAEEAAIDASFAAARALLDEGPHPLERARLELGWGESLRRAGRSADAAAHLEHALTRFDALGATGWADRTRRELEAASGRRRATRPRRTDALTPQELRVARHAASGMRDREIATLLYLSPRTVESYLSSAYRKLGVSNRTQLAAVLAAEGIGPGVPEMP